MVQAPPADIKCVVRNSGPQAAVLIQHNASAKIQLHLCFTKYYFYPSCPLSSTQPKAPVAIYLSFFLLSSGVVLCTRKAVVCHFYRTYIQCQRSEPTEN